MIKEIHCFGTSFTHGCWFEFHSNLKRENLLKYYKEKPFTQFNYSWPGQLQKLIGDGVRVYNHAKSGYGNERMYRIAYDLITEDIQSVSEKLFIFEFSFLGRKEFYSNTLKDHFIVNYEILENGANVYGIAQNYFENHVETYELLRNKIVPFVKETMQAENQIKTLRMNNRFFIDFLLQNNVNFLLATPPYGFDHENDLDGVRINLEDKHIQYSDTENTIYGYYYKNGWTITNETNGFIVDNHSGFHGNKETAKKILETIDKLYEYEHKGYTYNEPENKKLI